MEPETNIPPDK